MKKTVRKNTKYWRNETTMKIGHLAKAIAHAKAIAFAKWSVWVKKLKIPNTCKKPFYKNIWVVVCKKPFEKNIKYLRNETILKIGHLTKAIAHAKAIAFAKWSVWVQNYKCHKHVKNHSTSTLQLFCVKNYSKKHQVLEKWDDHENRSSYKGYSPCKGYSLRKMVGLGQKL